MKPIYYNFNSKFFFFWYGKYDNSIIISIPNKKYYYKQKNY